MRCHSGGYPGSPVIQPDQHMFHPNETPGGRCVDCHMPQTTYMQRHPRRDHGFTIPDPLLTQELGVPNAAIVVTRIRPLTGRLRRLSDGMEIAWIARPDREHVGWLLPALPKRVRTDPCWPC